MNKITQLILAECRNNFKTIAAFCCLFFMVGGAFGQTTISLQDFEASPATPVLTFSNAGGANSTGTNPGTGAPASANLFASGARGWQAVNTTSTLTFANQSLSGYTNAFINFRLAGMSVNSGNGIDGTDIVTISISVDGGTTYSSELTIAGSNSNQKWDFTATGTSSTTYDGNNVPTAITSSSGAGGISNVTINIPNSATQVMIKISMANNDSNERWVIDDVRIRGTVAAVPIVTSGTVNAAVGTNANYQIIATNSPSSYALASGTLPSGLTLNTTNGIISGTPTAVGSPSVTVTATNGSGTSIAATLNFVVAKGDQTITFATLANKQYGDDDFELTGTASSGLNVTYNSSNTNVATVLGNTVTILGVGTTEITASQAGNTNYNIANDVVRTLTITQRNLTVSGLTGDNKAYNASNVATVSGTPVLNNVLAADIANVTLSGTPTFTFANATIGVSKSITASGYSLAGSAAGNYSLTQPTGLTATISAKNITVTGAVAQNKVYNSNTIATVSGGTLIGVEAADNANVSVSTIGVFASANAGTGIGVTITLTGSAATNYSLTQPGLTADITKANQTITFNSLPTLNTGSAPINLNTFASTTSGLALTYMSSDSNVVSISGNTLTVVGLGTAIITASQAGNTNYNVGVNATQSVTVSLVPIVIAQFDFTTYSLPTAAVATAKNANVIVTDFAVSEGTLQVGQTTGNNFPNEPYASGSAAWTSASQLGAKNFNFNITANAGYKIEVTSFQFNALATGAGPSAFGFNIATGVSTYAVNAPDTNLVSVNQTTIGLTNLTSIPVLIQGWLNGSRTSSGAGVFRIDDVILKGYVTCIKPIAFEVTGGGTVCGTETFAINLSSSETGMNYQLKIDGVDSGSPVAGTGNALVFNNQNTLGSYTIEATNQYCSSTTTMTGSATITAGFCQTTWITTSPATLPAWTNGVPTASVDAIIAEDYNETTAISAKNLTINTGKVLTIQPANTLTVAGNLTNEGSVIFQSDASGTASFAKYTGDAIAGSGTSTVERYIPARRAWRILSAPLTGTNANTIATNWQGTNGEGVLLFSPSIVNSTAMVGYTTGGNAPNIKKYDAGWQNITNLTTEKMFGSTPTDTKAYLVFPTGASNSTNIATGADATTLRPKGQLITGNVTHTGLLANTFYALANPYASAINPVSLVSQNPGQKLWLVNPSMGTFGAYVTFDGTDWSLPTPTGNDAYIQSGQGFFVRSAAAASFAIKESDKVAGSSNIWFAKNANTTSSVTNPDKIRVLLYKQLESEWKLADGILSVNYADGSNDVDAMDTNKLSNFNESIMFRNNTTNLSIEHRSLPLATENQPLRLTGTTAIAYQLRVKTENYSNSLLIPVLEDTLNGTFTEIPTDGSEILIPFTGIVSTSTNPDNRFRIVYQTNLSNVDVSALVASVYPNPVVNNELHINLANNNSAAYTITNLLGQSIQTGKLVNTQNVITLNGANQGFYILNITQEGKSFTTKIYVQ